MGGGVNVANRTIFCRDNLDILKGINSNCIDLIYLDPPFNKKKTFIAPIGSKAQGASFKDIFKQEDVKEEWLYLLKSKHRPISAFIKGVKLGSKTTYNWCYLAYMAIRLIECHRILKDTGSIYLHCDPTMSHYLKVLMDCIFGEKNFRNEIVWAYTGPSNTKKWFPRKHDLVLYYVKTSKAPFYKDNVRVPYKPGMASKASGAGSQGIWSSGHNKDRVKELFNKGKVIEDWWSDITPVGRIKKELTGYPTQKPLALLRRIIKASTNRGDMVLDPFCGCATTCVAAEELGRQWIGVDVSPQAYTLVKRRLEASRQLNLSGESWRFKEINSRQDIPIRTDYRESKLPAYNHIDNKKHLFKEQSGHCAICDGRFRLRNLTVDHFHPRSKGGSNHLSNLQLLCGACNSLKGAKTMEVAIARYKQTQRGQELLVKT